MCLIVFAWQQAPQWPLLLAANRDEFHARPAAPADTWTQHPQVIAGRDLEAGGTWLGITTGGRFAAITNVRDPQAGERKAPRSRGELTLDFLSGNTSPGDYLEALSGRTKDYLGFNLLISDGQSLWYLHGDGIATPQCLGPGIYGLSNAALDVPWPKVELAKESMEQLLRGEMAHAPTHEALRQCTENRQLADADAVSGQGIPVEMARALSAQFIVTPAYGTRCMTTLRMGQSGSWDFEEQRFDAQGVGLGHSHFNGED